MESEPSLEAQLVYQHLQQLQQHLQVLEQHQNELQKLASYLHQFSSVSAGKPMYFPLGSGLFFPGIFNGNGTVLMNVGAGVCLEKTIPDALVTLEKQQKEIDSLIHQFEQQFEEGQLKLQNLQEA